MTVLTSRPGWLAQSDTLYWVVNQQKVKDSCNIKKGDFQFLRGDHRWKIISCESGTIWITQTNDPEDYLLKAGQAFLITKRGLVSIKGLEDSRIQCSPTLQKSPFKGKIPNFP